ncbi:unnamed protein product, partial [Iphiclides podalirius]
MSTATGEFASGVCARAGDRSGPPPPRAAPGGDPRLSPTCHLPVTCLSSACHPPALDQSPLNVTLQPTSADT